MKVTAMAAESLVSLLSIATTMAELPQGHTAPLHAVSRVKWLPNMTTFDYYICARKHECQTLNTDNCIHQRKD